MTWILIRFLKLDTGTNNQEESSALLGDGIEETAVDKAAANAGMH